MVYNLWPELSVFGLRVEVLWTDLWYEGCYWKGDAIFFCSLDFFIQGAHYGGSSSSSEDLIGPLFKIVPHCLSCMVVAWQSQDVSQQLPSPPCHGDRQWLCSCDLIQFIVGYFMWPLDPSHLSQLCSMKIVQFSLVILWHTPFSAVVQQYSFHLVSRTAGFWLSVSFSNSFTRLCYFSQGQQFPILFFSRYLPNHQALILVLSHFSILFPLLLILFSRW